MLFFGISIFSYQEYRVKKLLYEKPFSVGFIYNRGHAHGKLEITQSKMCILRTPEGLINIFLMVIKYNHGKIGAWARTFWKYVVKWCIHGGKWQRPWCHDWRADGVPDSKWMLLPLMCQCSSRQKWRNGMGRCTSTDKR